MPRMMLKVLRRLSRFIVLTTRQLSLFPISPVEEGRQRGKPRRLMSQSLALELQSLRLPLVALERGAGPGEGGCQWAWPWVLDAPRDRCSNFLLEAPLFSWP